MKTVHLFLLLSVAGIIVMVAADIVPGPKAEFLNAYSALQRIAGQFPSAGDSPVATQLGAVGESFLVAVVNLMAGGILAAIVRFLASR